MHIEIVLKIAKFEVQFKSRKILKRETLALSNITRIQAFLQAI